MSFAIGLDLVVIVSSLSIEFSIMFLKISLYVHCIHVMSIVYMFLKNKIKCIK
jgi:hypothetical protein